jgi:hypothetical protein
MPAIDQCIKIDCQIFIASLSSMLMTQGRKTLGTPDALDHPKASTSRIIQTTQLTIS